MYEISKDILDRAEKCASRSFCLSSPKEVLCEAEYLLNNNVLFVRKAKKRDCAYFLPYGNAGICSCPVRKALFQQYSV